MNNKILLAALAAFIVLINGGQLAQAATETVSGTLFFNSGVDTEPPVFSNVINHNHEVNTSFSYDVDATDAKNPLDAFILNDTAVFVVNRTTGIITNNTELNITATYWLNISINDTAGNLAWEIFYIDILPEVWDAMLGLIEGKFYQNKWFVYTYIEIPRDQDSIMPANSLYYSTNRQTLVYKDPGGTVRELY